METLCTYTDDLETARRLIQRDAATTRDYFYRQCYPLFRAVHRNFFTDCDSVREFIDEIYVLVLAPSLTTGRCQMENYKGESSLASWLKAVCLHYCYHKFERQRRIPVVEPLPYEDEKNSDATDRLLAQADTIEIDAGDMHHADVETILRLMPNQRYAQLMRLRYLDMKSNEETAAIMNISMDNYYNIHKRAKAQYERTLRKEDYYG